MSKRDDLNKYADWAGLYVRTYSPGDGVTRYRFFKHEESDCHCNGRQSYFGPFNGIYTALGLKEAMTYVTGALAHPPAKQACHDILRR